MIIICSYNTAQFKLNYTLHTCVATTQLDTLLKTLTKKPACIQKIDYVNMHSKCMHVRTYMRH